MGCGQSSPAPSGGTSNNYPKQQMKTVAPPPQPQAQKLLVKKNYPTQPMKNEVTAQPQEQQQQAPPPPQAQPTAPPAPPAEKKAEWNDAEIKKKVERYVEIEKQILEMEAKNLPKSLEAKKGQVETVKKSQAEITAQYKAACDKVAKEKADVDKMQNPTVKAFFKDQQEFDEKMSKEQEEYLEAVSEQEMVKKQLDDINQQTAALTKDSTEMTKEMNKLLELYDEQDQILDDIFSGEYGSDLENKLELEVDQLLDRKERIGVAKYKWTNGRLLLQHASNQLGFAVKKWTMLSQVPLNYIPARYQLATETRNNLIAAMANITSAKRYLNNIKFPYCETEEMNTLDKACRNIYIDMQTHDRYQHAMQCYSVTHRRSAALLQWFDNVIQNTIEKDLAKAKAELTPKKSALRKERLKLMKEKCGGEASGLSVEDKDQHIPDDFDDDEPDPELMAISQPDQVEGDAQTMNSEDNLLSAGDEGQAPAPTPLPLSELAPPPSQEDLFGNIEELKKQHEAEQAQLEKVQETNKARMEQGLQEKLRRRRSKRRKMEEE